MTFKEIIAAKEAQKKELRSQLKATKTVEEITAINIRAEEIDEEIMNLRSAEDQVVMESRTSQEVLAAAAKGGRVTLDAKGTYVIGENRADGDALDGMEYRKAFMQFMQTGVKNDALNAGEKRDTTGASDVGYVVPPVVLNQIISKQTVYGSLYQKVRKISVAGGLSVPLITLKPTATWIASDGGTTTAQKQTAGSVTFSYFGLECKIATGLLVNIAGISAFEAKVVELIGEAMFKALDIGIVNGLGSGSNQMTGIVNDSKILAGQILTVASADFASWDGWKKKVFAKMPAAYRAGASFVMASGTWEGYIDGMVDANGQPVGRMNYGITDGSPQERFGGKEVIIVEDDVVKPYDTANTGDVVAIYGNLLNYAINSNMSLTMYRYLWQETNQWIDKGILIADGLVLDPYGFLVIKKGA
jgi:HK97 family phage major capsid protein